MRKPVLTEFGWKLLEELSIPETDLAMCSDPECQRFHLRRRGIELRVVMNSSVESLVRCGMAIRTPRYEPTYTISKRGLQELRRMKTVQQFALTSQSSQAFAS